MRTTLAAALLVLGTLALAAAPPARAEGFQTGTWYAGPRIWIGNLNDAVAIGGQVERGVTKPGEYGPGVIAVGAGLDYYSWSYDYAAYGSYKYSVVPVQVFGNYHLPLPKSPRWDPYAGLGLVYSHVSASWEGNAFSSGFSAAASTTDIVGNVGARYFVNDRFAVQAQVGFGYGTIGLGATWAF